MTIRNSRPLGEVRVLSSFVSLKNKLKLFESLSPFFWFLQLPVSFYVHQKAARTVRDKLRTERFDAIVLDYTKMAHYSSMVKNRRIKKILHVHNAESDLARQMTLSCSNRLAKAIYWFQWKLFESYERHFIPKCDLLLAPSQADAEFHQRLAPSIETAVIPNAVNTEVLQSLPPPEEPYSIVYPGRMDYPPNSQAVRLFCREILPVVAETFPDLRFYIVGKNPPPNVQELASDKVIVTGYVEDVLPYWRKASILAVPLSIGSGTRIKILEAMALGRPVISTSKGCEGLEVIHEKHLLIADDPERFAEHVIRVLKNPEEYFEMSRAARKLVEEKYSFAAIGDLLLRTLEDTLNEP